MEFLSWMQITRLGGSASMLAAAAVVLAWLIVGRAWRLAVWWVLLFVGGMGVVVISKLAFLGWGVGIRSLDFTGFSGHSMRVGAVLPPLFYLALNRWRPWVRGVGLVLAVAIAVVVGVSRLVLHAHSPSEIVAGTVLGWIVAAWFLLLCRRWSAPPTRVWVAAVGLVAVGLAWQANPLPTQRLLVKTALFLSGNERPVIRVEWRGR